VQSGGCGRRAPRYESPVAAIRTWWLVVRAKAARSLRIIQHVKSPDPFSNVMRPKNYVDNRTSRIDSQMHKVDSGGAADLRLFGCY
jgi:hypothetical protein